MCALGASTSQSRTIGDSSEIAKAKLVATVVFPVPPLPLAIAMIIGFTNLVIYGHHAVVDRWVVKLAQVDRQGIS
jgi:hypothetical protein